MRNEILTITYYVVLFVIELMNLAALWLLVTELLRHEENVVRKVVLITIVLITFVGIALIG